MSAGDVDLGVGRSYRSTDEWTSLFGDTIRVSRMVDPWGRDCFVAFRRYDTSPTWISCWSWDARDGFGLKEAVDDVRDLETEGRLPG